MIYQTIAAKFSDLLKRDLSPAEFKAMQIANKSEANQGVCHSHDYIDANMVMLEAFEELNLSTPIDFEHETDNHDQACALWNKSWNYANREFLS